MVTPVGRDLESTWKALQEGKSGVGLISLFDASSFATKIAAEAKAFDLAGYVDDADRWAEHCRNPQFAIAAARMALDNSGLESKTDLDRSAPVAAPAAAAEPGGPGYSPDGRPAPSVRDLRQTLGVLTRQRLDQHWITVGLAGPGLTSHALQQRQLRSHCSPPQAGRCQEQDRLVRRCGSHVDGLSGVHDSRRATARFVDVLQVRFRLFDVG